MEYSINIGACNAKCQLSNSRMPKLVQKHCHKLSSIILKYKSTAEARLKHILTALFQMSCCMRRNRVLAKVLSFLFVLSCGALLPEHDDGFLNLSSRYTKDVIRLMHGLMNHPSTVQPYVHGVQMARCHVKQNGFTRNIMMLIRIRDKSWCTNTNCRTLIYRSHHAQCCYLAVGCVLSHKRRLNLSKIMQERLD